MFEDGSVKFEGAQDGTGIVSTALADFDRWGHWHYAMYLEDDRGRSTAALPAGVRHRGVVLFL
jgi:hypothetical protein